MTYSIYALVDPRDSKTRYIGQTRQKPQNRLNNHCYTGAGHLQASQYVRSWVAELKAAGFKPVMVVMQQVHTGGDAYNAEMYWIGHFFSLGAKLLNCVGRPKPSKPLRGGPISTRSQAAYKAWERRWALETANGKRQ